MSLPRGGGKRRSAKPNPPWLMPGERITGEVTTDSGIHRRVTPRLLLPDGQVPQHLIEPTPEESAAYERRRAKIAGDGPGRRLGDRCASCGHQRATHDGRCFVGGCSCVAFKVATGGGGKRRSPYLVHVKDLRNKIVRYEGRLWRVDSMNGSYAYIRPLENPYGFGCKTVPASEIHDKVEGGKKRHAPAKPARRKPAKRRRPAAPRKPSNLGALVERINRLTR